MFKKILLSIIVFFTITLVFSVVLANDELQKIGNDIGNTVHNAENAVEGAVHNVTNSTQKATQAIENKTNKATTNAKNAISHTTSNGYNATRTGILENVSGNTFMGMNSTAWTWLIIGIATITIVSMVWYYSLQFNTKTHYDDKD